ncbi:hypothetical protein L218DRAFT_953570 [Marasmius fiardii PR-910]|nr:hypothetical protein L218DRAFT_953570 [Marasmius fiardii PR-910]
MYILFAFLAAFLVASIVCYQLYRVAHGISPGPTLEKHSNLIGITSAASCSCPYSSRLASFRLPTNQSVSCLFLDFSLSGCTLVIPTHSSNNTSPFAVAFIRIYSNMSSVLVGFLETLALGTHCIDIPQFLPCLLGDDLHSEYSKYVCMCMCQVMNK